MLCPFNLGFGYKFLIAGHSFATIDAVACTMGKAPAVIFVVRFVSLSPFGQLEDHVELTNNLLTDMDHVSMQSISNGTSLLPPPTTLR